MKEIKILKSKLLELIDSEEKDVDFESDSNPIDLIDKIIKIHSEAYGNTGHEMFNLEACKLYLEKFKNRSWEKENREGEFAYLIMTIHEI